MVKMTWFHRPRKEIAFILFTSKISPFPKFHDEEANRLELFLLKLNEWSQRASNRL